MRKANAPALPLVEQAELVRRLPGSLEAREAANAKEIENAWIEEAHRRYQALLSGADPGQTHEQLFAELRAERR